MYREYEIKKIIKLFFKKKYREGKLVNYTFYAVLTTTKLIKMFYPYQARPNWQLNIIQLSATVLLFSWHILKTVVTSTI